MSDTTTLKPCPFCGLGSAKAGAHTDYCYFSLCAAIKSDPEGDLSRAPDILDAWNRRAAPVPASTGREPEAWAVIDGDGKILETSVHKWAVESWLKYDDARKLVPLYGNLLAARELDADAERLAFEAQAALDDYRPLRRNSEAGNYTSAVVEACWSIWQAARATTESAPASAAPRELPEILFDGNAVYAEITRKLGKSHCHNHEAVSATLDAVARLMRAPSNSPVGAKEQDNG